MLPWLALHGWSLQTNHVLLLITFVVCGWSAARRLRARDPIAWQQARWGLAGLALVPWLGGHLHFVLTNWRYARTSPAVLLIPWNGIHAAGAIIALTLVTPLVLYRYALRPGPVADALVPTIGIGIMLARLGCFADGCCFGPPCAWPWCVAFPRASFAYELHLGQRLIAPHAIVSLPVHPLQLYFAAVGLALWAFAHWYEPRKCYDGHTALIALVLFAVAAAVLEPLRATDDARVYWGPLPQLQWTALALSTAAIVVLWIVTRRVGTAAAGNPERWAEAHPTDTGPM